MTSDMVELFIHSKQLKVKGLSKVNRWYLRHVAEEMQWADDSIVAVSDPEKIHTTTRDILLSIVGRLNRDFKIVSKDGDEILLLVKSGTGWQVFMSMSVFKIRKSNINRAPMAASIL